MLPSASVSMPSSLVHILALVSILLSNCLLVSSSESNCTLCLGDLPEEIISFHDENLTCDEWGSKTLELNESSCLELQSLATVICGCGSQVLETNISSSDLVECYLCAGNTVPTDGDARFNIGAETLSCQTIYEQGPRMLTQENCNALQNRGDTICLCGQDTTVPNDCTLCEDGSSLPSALFSGRPGDTCVELEVDASRDVAENCPVWRGTVGIYCGCNNSISFSTLPCHLCGQGGQLLNHLAMVDYNGTTVSCGEMEFIWNVASLLASPIHMTSNSTIEGSCSSFQDNFSDFCCAAAPTAAPKPPSTSGSLGIIDLRVITSLSSALMILFL